MTSCRAKVYPDDEKGCTEPSKDEGSRPSVGRNVLAIQDLHAIVESDRRRVDAERRIPSSPDVNLLYADANRVWKNLGDLSAETQHSSKRIGCFPITAIGHDSVGGWESQLNVHAWANRARRDGNGVRRGAGGYK